MSTVLVLDGNTLSALSIVRSLGRLGNRVLVAASDSAPLAGASRYTHTKLNAPNIRTDVGTYVKWIAGTIAEHDVDYVFWTTTETTLALDRFRSYLSPVYTLDLPPSDVIEKAYDKAETIRLAIEVGISVPKTWIFDNLEEIRSEALKLSWPCVVKSRQSFAIIDNQIVNGGRPRYVNDERGLFRAFADLNAIIRRPLVQEFVLGDGFGIFLLMQDGLPIATFAHHRIREADPTGSGSSFRISVEPPPDAYELSVRLLQAMRWKGVAMVEFKRDQRDKQPKLMEVNGRFWSSLALALEAGVDFPALLLDVKAGLSLREKMPAYRTGIGCHWLEGELEHLLAILKGKPTGFPGNYPTRRETLPRMAYDLIAHPRFDTFQADDPWPAIFDFGMMIWRGLGKINDKLRRGN